MSKYSKHYIRAGCVPFERVLPYIGRSIGRWYCGHQVKLESLRLRLFRNKAKELFCIKCGIKAQYFAVERAANTHTYHLCLYAINDEGHDMLMTKDHIIPRSKGGANHLSNLQVMCANCNCQKGSS